MLIAAIIILLLHGSSAVTLLWPYDQTTKLVKQDVTDEARQKQAVEIIDDMKAANKAFAKQREKSVEALAQLSAKRETSAAEFQHASETLVTEDKAAAEKLLDLRFQLKSVLTASEWAEVFPPARATSKNSS